MTKRALAILIAAVLLVGGGAAAVASNLGSSTGTTHSMPNGHTMDGTMNSMGDSEAMPDRH